MHAYELLPFSTYPSEKTAEEIVDFILSLPRPGGASLANIPIASITSSHHIKGGTVYNGKPVYHLHSLRYNTPLIHWNLVFVNRYRIDRRKKFFRSSYSDRKILQAAVDSPMPPVVIAGGSILDGNHRLSRVKSESIEQPEAMPFLAYVAKFPYDA